MANFNTDPSIATRRTCVGLCASLLWMPAVVAQPLSPAPILHASGTVHDGAVLKAGYGIEQRVQRYEPAGGPATHTVHKAQVVVEDVDPLAVTPAMAAFLAERIEAGMQRETRLRKLQESIFDAEDGLGIVYGTHGTFTAAETFERATGNCLSFTLLFVAMARHLGFITHFVEVDEVTGWSRQGGVSFNHWHMFAEVELANGVVQVDFLPWSERRYRARRRIDENRMRAHFFNNVGAQKLAPRGPQDEAIAHFRKALELDADVYPGQAQFGGRPASCRADRAG